MAQLEIACFNLASALIAQENGADRVELCDGFEVGGTTPSMEAIINAKKLLTISVNIMIRPRGGGFVYTASEFEQMKSDLLAAKKCNVDGFVFGILNDDNTVNMDQNKILVDLAKPLACTFHRAFDEVLDAFQALEQIIDCGFRTILTSGQAQNATQGLHRLTELAAKATNRICIMPGGSLRSSNIGIVRQQTKADWFHSSAITDDTIIADPNEIIALKSNLR